MRRRSSGSAGVRFFRLDYARIMAELREYAKKALAKRVRAVILIGSLARGDYTAFSDADLLIVVDEDPRRPLDRLVDFMDPTLPVDLDLRVYTIRELLRMAEEGRRLAREVVEYGRLLAGDKSVLDEMARLLKRGRKRA